MLFGSLGSRGVPSALQCDVNRCHGFFNDHIPSRLQEAVACGYTLDFRVSCQPEILGFFWVSFRLESRIKLIAVFARGLSIERACLRNISLLIQCYPVNLLLNCMPPDILSCIVFISKVAFSFLLSPPNCTLDCHHDDAIISFVIIIWFFYFLFFVWLRPGDHTNMAKLQFHSQISCGLEAKQLSDCSQAVRSAHRRLNTH